MEEIQQRDATANGIRIHYAELGTGPLVLLCHGFPEGWYSWRDQLHALAQAGYRAVAPDMRGYGGTEAPAARTPSSPWVQAPRLFRSLKQRCPA